jgi:hypothetical protein
MPGAGMASDTLEQRRASGQRPQAEISSEFVHILAPFPVDGIGQSVGGGPGFTGRHRDRGRASNVDRMVGADGFLPDFSFLRELRIAIDPALEARVTCRRQSIPLCTHAVAYRPMEKPFWGTRKRGSTSPEPRAIAGLISWCLWVTRGLAVSTRHWRAIEPTRSDSCCLRPPQAAALASRSKGRRLRLQSARSGQRLLLRAGRTLKLLARRQPQCSCAARKRSMTAAGKKITMR